MVWHTPFVFSILYGYLQSCYYSPIKLLFRDFPKTLWKVLACHPNKCQDWRTQIFFHVPSFSICSHQVPSEFSLCSQFVPPCSCYVLQHILNSTLFFKNPICFGKCCLALTGPPPSVLPHIKHMRIFFFHFFWWYSVRISEFFFRQFFSFCQPKKWEFFGYFVFS
jgi:hypothetical protein